MPPIRGRYSKAAVLHDWLYARGKHSRKFCDDVFCDAMVAQSVSLWKRVAIYYGVRVGGWVAWRAHRRK